MLRRGLWITAWALALLPLGCAGGEKGIPVEGTVTLDGKAVDGATVTYQPEGDKGKVATGVTDAGGKFKLSTAGAGDGAAAGDYKVTVTKLPIFNEAAPKAAEGETSVEAQYRQSYLKAGTKAQQNQLPALYENVTTTPLKQKVPPSGPVKLELESKKK